MYSLYHSKYYLHKHKLVECEIQIQCIPVRVSVHLPLRLKMYIVHGYMFRTEILGVAWIRGFQELV